MDAREQLRRYLEQRREMGETELVLDGMSVDEALRILGASEGSAANAQQSPTSGGRPGGTPADDWRATLRAASAQPEMPAPVHRAGPLRPSRRIEDAEPTTKRVDDTMMAPAPVSATTLAPGLIIGSAEHELFSGPYSHLMTVDEIAAEVARCTRCPLYATALNPVPGEGDARAELVCVGEAPGATEDETGRPFVGQAGQLLTKILAAIKLRREDVFICNVLKHRPPGNRNPRPEEIQACHPYLLRQLEVIRPKAVLALGTIAAQTLLQTKLSIGKLRGAIHKYYGVPLIVTYHPAALLRNPAWKRPTWEDVQLVRRILDSSA